MTKGIAGYDSIEEFRSPYYSKCLIKKLMDEGVMIAAVSGALYSNGTGCGRTWLVTCVDDVGDICSDYNQVVVKITHHRIYYLEPGHVVDITLSREAYDTIANTGKSETINITYQIYNYTPNTLKQGQALDLSTQQLVSANYLFALGNYKHRYMAIFLRNGNLRPLWIGNRNQPSYNKIVLALDITGELILRIRGISSNIMLYGRQTEDGINMTATLLDSGNLVLRETNSDGLLGRTLWQSFDYPTDTLLPGMKLGINHKMGQNWTLKSWSSASTPDEGAFSLEWDLKGRALVFRQRGVIYWTSGTLTDTQNFEFLHPNDSSLNFTNVTNEDEDYFTYNMLTTEGGIHMKTINISELVLEYNGRISIRDSSSVLLEEGFCSGRSKSSGCQKRQQPKCRPQPRSFELRSGTFINPQNVTDHGSYGHNITYVRMECQEQCWKNCSCVGYSLSDSSYCRFWTGKDLSFVQDHAGTSSPIYVLNPELRNLRHKWIWLIILTIVSVVIMLIGIVYYIRRKIRQRGMLITSIG